MTQQEPMTSHDPKVQRLLRFLEQDPTNPGLLADTAQAAFDARQLDLAQRLIERRAGVGALPPELLNFAAVVAMAREDYADAATTLETLRQQGHDTAQSRFNHAWALMILERFDEADQQLDSNAIDASPHGPSLKIQALHHLEKFDEGLALGEVLATRYPHDEKLMGALATLAMDAGRIDVAQTYALQAGDNADGLAARGLLALDQQKSEEALSLFDHALERQPGNARAWVGKGLALLTAGQPADAATAIEQGANVFGDHLGSWVAAGWAHFLSGDQDAAREAFNRVVALDGTFAEGHGGLAVLDLMAGDVAAAKHNSAIALRLDRTSLGGALATTLLLQLAGDDAGAQKIRSKALSLPIGPRGQTLAQMLSEAGTHMFRG